LTETSQEVFILKMYREHNKNGFIKGFSEYAESFAVGFSHLEKTTKYIYAPSVLLYPRFVK